MSVLLERDSTAIRVRVNGWDRLRAWSGDIDVPIAAVLDARSLPRPDALRGALRVGGTSVPGRLHEGRFRREGRTEFWYVRESRQLLVIDLAGHRFSRLVLDVPDPTSTAREIRLLGTVR
jgi:hypothetical protein